MSEVKKIIIQGVTEEGESFRPSDWADRLCGQIACFDDNRMHYDPRLRPMTNEQGHRCVLLDPELQKTKPKLYASILKFAEENKLPMCEKA